MFTRFNRIANSIAPLHIGAHLVVRTTWSAHAQQCRRFDTDAQTSPTDMTSAHLAVFAACIAFGKIFFTIMHHKMMLICDCLCVKS